MTTTSEKILSEMERMGRMKIKETSAIIRLVKAMRILSMRGSAVVFGA
ncbi:MAG: hypothetical protein IIU73_00270 [Selenomonadales bacterium]|nr:hypothetical protein [Selenomonadales bacterium]